MGFFCPTPHFRRFSEKIHGNLPFFSGKSYPVYYKENSFSSFKIYFLFRHHLFTFAWYRNLYIIRKCCTSLLKQKYGKIKRVCIIPERIFPFLPRKPLCGQRLAGQENPLNHYHSYRSSICRNSFSIPASGSNMHRKHRRKWRWNHDRRSL